MNASPLEPLRALFGDTLQDLAGAVVAGELPLRTTIVNRMIAEKLAAANAPVASAEVETRPDDAATVRLRPKLPIPLLTIDVRIDRQPNLPHDAQLGLRWALRGAGVLTMLAGPVISYFKKLPPGVTIEGDRIWIDLHTILRAQGLGEIVPLLTGLRVTTREHAFVIAFELRR